MVLLVVLGSGFYLYFSGRYSDVFAYVRNRTKRLLP